MSLVQTLLVGAVGGVLTGGLAIVGVLVAAGRAADAAVKESARRDAEAEAADTRREAASERADARREATQQASDRRRDVAEHQRWSAEKRLAAYGECLAACEDWTDGAIDHAITRRVMGEIETDRSNTSLSPLISGASRALAIVRILGGREVRRAATALSRACSEVTKLCRECPLPSEAAFKDADESYVAARHDLMDAVRKELDWIVANDEPL